MATMKLTLHFHHFAITVEDFEKKLSKTNKMIQTDTHSSGVKYVTAMEALEYPFFSVLYHPEYNMDNCEEANQIAQGMSDVLYDYALRHQAATLERRKERKVKLIDESMTIYTFEDPKRNPCYGRHYL